MRTFTTICSVVIATIIAWNPVWASSGNQTSTVSPIYPQDDSLPFSIEIETISLMIPNGIHSNVTGIYKDKWLLLAGRTNGLHGFSNDDFNFPVQKQNTVAFVVDVKANIVYSRPLDDPNSGLSQQQIDELSVTSPQYFQKNNVLYITGGYGVDTATGLFSTKSTLTAIDIPEFIDWVIQPTHHNSPAVKHIRQTSDPFVQVTGGYMDAVNSKLSTLLIFGQNFSGYYEASSNGDYTQQVRRFQIVDNGKQLFIKNKISEPLDPSYRRRDLNVIPIIRNNKRSYVALSGVFTAEGGIWTVPVFINRDGTSFMPNPSNPNTFKQGMNNYTSAVAGIYDKKTGDNYLTLLGGISFGFFQNGNFETDNEIPFINQVTTVQIDKHGNFTQYLMDNEYPTILSTGSNPGNPLLFGAGATFYIAPGLKTYCNEVIPIDQFKTRTTLGYIVGGIMSTLPNTNTMADSAASPYIFRVVITPTRR